MAEIDEKVTICEHRGGEVKEIRVEKYALISTHTARRSFATHLQRSKVPLSSISMALGHKKVTTTMDENAAILAGSSFFKDFEEDE
jgi:integrase